MSGPILTLLLVVVVIVIAGASYRRRGVAEAPAHERAYILVGLAAAMAALGTYFLYIRHHP